MIKLHKSAIGMRWITGVSSFTGTAEQRQYDKDHNLAPATATTYAHQHLSSILKNAMTILKEKDMHSRFKRYWIVESDDEVSSSIKQNLMVLKKLSPKTFDFTTMYTRLPHNAIKTKVSEALQEAFSFKNILRLESSDPTRFPSLALAECQKLLEFCIDSSFIALRGYIWRQIIGIPMGGNASSDIANLYCYRVESTYIDSLIEAKNLDLARQHDHSCRYIDDFLTWSCDPPPASLYSMDYTDTSNNIDDVSYIGIRIRIEITNTNKRWIRLSVNDKARGWHITPTRFTHQHSAAQESMGSGIFTTMILRALKICNNQADFLQELEAVTYRLLNRGYKSDNIRAACLRFISSHIDDGNTAAAMRRRINLTFEKFSHKVPLSIEKDTINHTGSTSHSLDKRFPPSLHQTSGEGLLGGECGWAALNFIADHLYIDRINFSFLQNYQQRFYEESLKVEPNNSEHKPSPDGWFSLQVLNMACMTKFNRRIEYFVNPADFDYPEAAAALILHKAKTRMTHFIVALVSFESMIIRDILKGTKDLRLPFDHFDKMYQTTEYSFHMIPLKAQTDMDVTMTPANIGPLMVCEDKVKRKLDDDSSINSTVIVKRPDVKNSN